MAVLSLQAPDSFGLKGFKLKGNIFFPKTESLWTPFDLMCLQSVLPESSFVLFKSVDRNSTLYLIHRVTVCSAASQRSFSCVAGFVLRLISGVRLRRRGGTGKKAVASVKRPEQRSEFIFSTFQVCHISQYSPAPSMLDTAGTSGIERQ